MDTGDLPGDITLASYDAAADVYREHSTLPVPAVAAYLDRLARLVDGGTVLELGSGPGLDAAHLELRGAEVLRTDGAPAFVAMLQAGGHEARLLDVRTGDLGGPHDAVLADAVLLHLTREELADVLVRARRAVRPGGWLAVTLKEGDGEGWSTAKLGLPRFFTYWRAPALRAALEAAGWEVVSLEGVEGRREPWLFVLARDGGGSPDGPGRGRERAVRPDVQVRAAGAGDLGALVQCVTALHAEDGVARDPLRDPGWPGAGAAAWCADLVADPTTLVLVVTADGVVVGHLVGSLSAASAMWRAPRAELVSTWVAPTWRGQGLGGRLVEAFGVWARDRGAARVQLSAYAGNASAVRFYQRHGYAPQSVALTLDLP